jgi:hypothetical protein
MCKHVELYEEKESETKYNVMDFANITYLIRYYSDMTLKSISN